MLAEAIKASAAEVVTVSLRREAGAERGGQSFWSFIRALGVRVLPNTAGCHSVKEAVTTAHMARELFDTPWIKLEVIRDDETLQPDVFGLVEAARVLTEDGFEVFPYTTEDLAVADRLVEAGCRVLMPWGAPIGSARGLNNRLRAAARCARISLTFRWWSMPGSACRRTPRRRWSWATTPCCSTRRSPKRAIPSRWPRRSRSPIEAGRMAFAARPLEPRDMAVPSTPVLGKAALGD